MPKEPSEEPQRAHEKDHQVDLKRHCQREPKNTNWGTFNVPLLVLQKDLKRDDPIVGTFTSGRITQKQGSCGFQEIDEHGLYTVKRNLVVISFYRKRGSWCWKNIWICLRIMDLSKLYSANCCILHIQHKPDSNHKVQQIHSGIFFHKLGANVAKNKILLFIKFNKTESSWIIISSTF